MRRTVLPLLLMTLCPGAIAGPETAASWRQGWGMANDGHISRPSARPPQLLLENHGVTVQVHVLHNAAGPLQVRLRSRGPAMAGLPLQRVLPGPGRHHLLTLPPGPASQLVPDAVPGLPDARADTGTYALPFESSTAVRVHQAAHGQHSHQDLQNRHAWDFALPEGTPVLAAREGLVMDIHGAAAGPVTRPGDGGNWVRIAHPDGTMAVYAHLQPGSLAVRPGQRVRRGQLLARSGNTGHSTAPHLHFVVQRNAGLRLESLPVQLNGPRGRLQASTHSSTAP